MRRLMSPQFKGETVSRQTKAMKRTQNTIVLGGELPEAGVTVYNVTLINDQGSPTTTQLWTIGDAGYTKQKVAKYLLDAFEGERGDGWGGTYHLAFVQPAGAGCAETLMYSRATLGVLRRMANESI